MKIYRVIATGALVVLALTGIYAAYTRERRVKQPIAYNHKVHVDFGMACVSCHTGVAEGGKASIPNVQVCALCHVPGKENPKTPPNLERHIRDMATIPWEKIYALPHHVHFSHERHTQAAKIECTTCHGDIPKQTGPLTHRLVRMDMTDCMDCHRKEKVTTDCQACHR